MATVTRAIFPAGGLGGNLARAVGVELCRLGFLAAVGVAAAVVDHLTVRLVLPEFAWDVAAAALPGRPSRERTGCSLPRRFFSSSTPFRPVTRTSRVPELS